MNAIRKEAGEMPQDIELLLPWHAAGTLSRRDAARVEQALANDNELAARYELVREELGEAICLNENLGAPSALAIVLQAGILAGVFVKEGAVGPQLASHTQEATTDGAYVDVRFKPDATA